MKFQESLLTISLLTGKIDSYLSHRKLSDKVEGDVLGIGGDPGVNVIA